MRPPRLFWHNEDDIQQVAQLLKRELLILASTDTVYGLLAPCTSAGRKALDRLKRSRIGKAYLVLVSRSSLSTFIAPHSLTPKLQELLSRIWPGPVTIIFRAHEDLDESIRAPDGTIALRCPAHDGLQALLQHFDGLFSTSANISGEPIPETADAIDPAILAGVSAFIDTGDQLDKTTPSTILDCSTENEITLIREGATPLAQLEELYGAPIKRKDVSETRS